METYDGNDEAKKFYMNINDYHEKSYVILKLIVDYFNKTKRNYSKEFVAMRFEHFELKESNITLTEIQKERVEVWLKSSDRDDLFNSIFKIELLDKVFLFKMFEFSEGDVIFAGYALEDSVSVRSFLASFNEMKIQEKYERILSII
jgi:hypothetical protein